MSDDLGALAGRLGAAHAAALNAGFALANALVDLVAERDRLRDERDDALDELNACGRAAVATKAREVIRQMLRDGVDVARVAIEEWPDCPESRAIAERDRLRRIVEHVANSPKVDVSGAGSHFDALIPCDVVREALGGGDGR